MAIPTEKKLIKELELLESDQHRIDCIRNDIDSKVLRYEDISFFKLSKLVGIDCDDPDSWGTRIYLAHKIDLGESDFLHPFAMNVSELEGFIPKTRFSELISDSSKILRNGRPGTDICLNHHERNIINEKYSTRDGFSDIVLLSSRLESSCGNHLEFTASIGDGGDIEDTFSPYDIHFGRSFNFDDWVVVE
jgi:hypothetical protein